MAGRYESHYLRAVDPDRPRGAGSATRRSSARAARRPRRSGARSGTPRRGPPVTAKVTRRRSPARPSTRAGPAAAVAVRGDGPGRARRGTCASSAAAAPLRHLPHPRLYAAPLPRTKLESPAPAARVSGTVDAGERGARARRLARDGRPQLGRAARGDAGSGCTASPSTARPAPGSTSPSAASGSPAARRRGSPTARSSSTARRHVLGGLRAPRRGRRDARRAATRPLGATRVRVDRPARPDRRLGLRRPARRRAPRAQLLDRAHRGRARRPHARERPRRRLRAGHARPRPRRPRGTLPRPVSAPADPHHRPHARRADRPAAPRRADRAARRPARRRDARRRAHAGPGRRADRAHGRALGAHGFGWYAWLDRETRRARRPRRHPARDRRRRATRSSSAGRSCRSAGARGSPRSSAPPASSVAFGPLGLDDVVAFTLPHNARLAARDGEARDDVREDRGLQGLRPARRSTGCAAPPARGRRPPPSCRGGRRAGARRRARPP